MALDLSQIQALSEAFPIEFISLEDLVMFAAEFNYDLFIEVPEGPLKYRAFIFIQDMNNSGRHEELLNRLMVSEYPLLKARAEEILDQLETPESGESAGEEAS